MRVTNRLMVLGSTFLLSLLLAVPARADVSVQCPRNLLTQNATHQPCTGGVCTFNPRTPALSSDRGCRKPEDPNFYSTCKVQVDPVTGQPSGATTDPTVVCRSITCGDGHVDMADGNELYIFGFRDSTNAPEAQVMNGSQVKNADGMEVGAAEFAAPTLIMREGQRMYLTLNNAGMMQRPDLTDAHTIHYHGFPNAASVFDGEPMASFGIAMGSSLTYFYDNQYAGTYMWHCHVEAAEHMQMGMLGNLYVMPKQDGSSITDRTNSKVYSRFAYDDCPTAADRQCGTTGYDVMYFLQETGFDPKFHHADETYQKVPFAAMDDTYALLNGRGYPDTIDPGVRSNGDGVPSQPLPAVPFTVDAQGHRKPLAIKQGQRLLLHLSSLATEQFYTLTTLGIPMRIVGQGAQLLRGPTGTNTAYTTSSLTMSGGEGYDVILDTAGVPTGTYFMYTTNLNHLSNDAEDFGGMMTEIVVN